MLVFVFCSSTISKCFDRHFKNVVGYYFGGDLLLL